MIEFIQYSTKDIFQSVGVKIPILEVEEEEEEEEDDDEPPPMIDQPLTNGPVQSNNINIPQK
jgi:hypothetical protein